MRSPHGLHETPEDKARERAIVEFFCQKWGCVPKYTPTAYHVDALLVKDKKPMAFLEVRRRNRAFHGYPDVTVSLEKWAELEKYTTYLPTFYGIQFDDGYAFRQVNKGETLPVHMMERNTGDPRDNEPCVALPMTSFKRVNP
jgi:hypothetical protein